VTAPAFVFRPLARDDFPTLSRWLAAPHVARWWADDPSSAALEAQYGPGIDGAEPWEDFIAVRDGMDVGLIQRYPIHADPDSVAELRPLVALPDGVMSIDYLIGDPAHTGRGWGTAMIAEFVARLWRDHRRCPCLVVPVHHENRASWRALERCGFRRVATGELTPDNPADSRAHVILRRDRPDGSAGGPPG
jgi:aminoglycoside 6'-N-acetyltransferase